MKVNPAIGPYKYALLARGDKRGGLQAVPKMSARADAKGILGTGALDEGVGSAAVSSIICRPSPPCSVAAEGVRAVPAH